MIIDVASFIFYAFFNNYTVLGCLVYPCKTCGRVYKAKRSLWRHLKFECQQAPKFKCPICPYKAKQKCSVVSHVLNKHRDLDCIKHKAYDSVNYCESGWIDWGTSLTEIFEQDDISGGK